MVDFGVGVSDGADVDVHVHVDVGVSVLLHVPMSALRSDASYASRDRISVTGYRAEPSRTSSAIYASETIQCVYQV